MSQHSDDQQLMQVGSDSFWEPGNYKRTTRRLDDGHRLCADLSQLVAERADIEKAYAKSLKGWAKKWNDLIEKGPEYGTTEAAWKGILVEAERLGDLHLKVRDRLVEDVMQQIKNWQKDNYHKTMMNIKERKEMDEAFKKAQKPWMKRFQKVDRAKADYHTACKQERTAHNQERNATGDTSLSPDQRAIAVKKMGERVSRSKEEVTKTREKYQVALAEINAYNPRYVEDMGGVFDRCQAMEAQRLLFFKDVLFGVHKCINISQDPVLPQIYEEFYHTIGNADHHKDLKWWSNNHGVNMPMAWPQFEKPPDENYHALPLVDQRLYPVLTATGLSQMLTTASTHLDSTASNFRRVKFSIGDKIDSLKESNLMCCLHQDRRKVNSETTTARIAPSVISRSFETHHYGGYAQATQS